MRHNKLLQNESFHYHHKLLMVFCGFFLLQDLIANNLKEMPLAFSVIKYSDELLVMIFYSFCVLYPLIAIEYKPIKGIIAKLLSLFLLVGIISSIVTRVPVFVSAPQILLYLKGFLLFYIFASLPFNEIILRKYIRFFLCVALLLFAFGLVDLVVPGWFRTVTGNIGYEDFRGGILSVKSLFIHPGVFGWFMAYIALYCFAFFLIFTKRSYLFAGLIFSLGCLLSMRAKPLGGLVGGVLVGLAMLPLSKRIRRSMVFIAIAFCMGVPLWPQLSELYQSKVAGYVEVSDPMLQARNALYIKGVEIAKDYFPLGAGLGRYGSWMSVKYYSPLYDEYDLSRIYGMSEEKASFNCDTFWPMVLGETGFIGFVFYAGILFCFVKTLCRQVKNTDDKFLMAFQLGTLMILAESLIESLASPVYISGPFVYYIFGSIGICYSLNNHKLLK